MKERRRWVARVVVRGAALFLGVFTLIGLIGTVRGRMIDASLWIVDLRDVPVLARFGLLAAFSGLLIAWSLRRAPNRAVRRATAAICLLMAAFACRDAVTFAAETHTGLVRAAIPLPLSLFIAAGLVVLAVAALRVARATDAINARAVTWTTGAAGAWAVVFALAQMVFFGTTDYRRPADAAVVFGAGVYASGQPSPLLTDRIRTGVELYRAGLTPILVMSGGDGSDGFNEARVMRDAAVAAGVDPADVVVDPVGVSTEATVTDTMALLAARDGSDPSSGLRLLAVSQAYHLPRVQLAFEAAGIDVLTVPTIEAQPIGEMPILIAREVPGFWVYYVRACLF